MVLTRVADAATPSPFGQDVTGRAPIDVGDANPVAVPTRPSERDTQRVVIEETHFLPMMPRRERRGAGADDSARGAMAPTTGRQLPQGRLG